MSMEDLATILVPPPTQAVTYGQGKILSWDPDTFENAIEWRGITLHNLPVLSGAEALTYQSGDVVGLLGWAPNPGATGSWWILGRLVLPGAGRAEAAIQWMTSTLGAALARSVIAEVIQADSNLVQGTTTTEDAWVDLTFGGNPNPGPEVTVEIGPARRAVVLVMASIQNNDAGQGWMSFEVSGATSRAPSILGAATLRSHNLTNSAEVGSTGINLVDNLNEGTHTFTAKYRVSNLGSNLGFSNRVLLVIPF